MDVNELHDKIKEFGVETTESYPINSLDEIKKWCNTFSDTEGWVIIFEDNTLAKMKTQWYFDQHKITLNEKTVLHAILSSKVDEIITDLKESHQLDEAEKIQLIKKDVIDYIKYIELFIISTTYKFNDMPDKDLFMKFKKFPYIGVLMSYRKHNDNLHEKIIQDIINKTGQKEKAKNWLKKELDIKL